MSRNYYDRRRYRGTDPYILVLLLQLAQKVADLPNKPPVTVAFMAAQAFIYFSPIANSMWDLDDVCIEPYSVLYLGQVKRLWLSTLFHVDEYHLYYNLSSFLLKGYLLEQLYGSEAFGLMIIFFMFASNIIYVLFALVGGTIIGSEALMFQRAVGFSGVLFALKVVLQFNDEGEASLLGFRVPSKHIYWAELLLIRVLVPNSSFIGHLRSFSAPTYGSGRLGRGNGDRGGSRTPRQTFINMDDESPDESRSESRSESIRRARLARFEENSRSRRYRA